MSRFWAAPASTGNRLVFDQGATTAGAYPYFYGGFVKFSDLSAARTILSHSENVALRRGQVGSLNTGAVFINERSSVASASAIGTAGGAVVGTWIPILGVQILGDSRIIYWGSSANSAVNAVNQGVAIPNRYTYVGVLGENVTFSNPMLGWEARLFRVLGAVPTIPEITAWMGGVQAHDIWTCYGSWPLEGSDLTDHSGNGRTLSVVGTVAPSSDEPFPTALSGIPPEGPLRSPEGPANSPEGQAFSPQSAFLSPEGVNA